MAIEKFVEATCELILINEPYYADDDTLDGVMELIDQEDLITMWGNEIEGRFVGGTQADLEVMLERCNDAVAKAWEEFDNGDDDGEEE